MGFDSPGQPILLRPAQPEREGREFDWPPQRHGGVALELAAVVPGFERTRPASRFAEPGGPLPARIPAHAQRQLGRRPLRISAPLPGSNRIGPVPPRLPDGSQAYLTPRLGNHASTQPAALSRRGLLTVLPAGAAGCLGCSRAAACAQQSQEPLAGHSWTEKADLSWEEIFRFAYQKDLIPLLRAMSERVGREEFVRMLQEAGDAVVRKKAAGRPPRSARA